VTPCHDGKWPSQLDQAQPAAIDLAYHRADLFASRANTISVELATPTMQSGRARLGRCCCSRPRAYERTPGQREGRII
jgi:hypothetical protein